jgi:hypothetical protein
MNTQEKMNDVQVACRVGYILLKVATIVVAVYAALLGTACIVQVVAAGTEVAQTGILYAADGARVIFPFAGVPLAELVSDIVKAAIALVVMCFGLYALKSVYTSGTARVRETLAKVFPCCAQGCCGKSKNVE